MHVIMTRVKLKEGMAGQCAQLFEDTNPGLVREEPDWLGARMLFDPETHIVTVLATWRDAASYARLRDSTPFRETMQAFADLFAGPPEISVTTLLVDMTPDGV